MDTSTVALTCREIWGGNRRADQTIEFGNLRGRLVSLPFESDQGGDIYFLSLCDQEMLSKIVVADVAGHGEIVSSIGRELRNLLRENVNEVDNTKLLMDLNYTLRHKLRQGRFVTMVTATYNGETREVVYAYAGHPTVFRFKAAKGEWRPLHDVNGKDSGIPLGIIAGTEYVQAKTKLEEGDALFLYTDGLIDVRKKGDERLRVDGLLEACRAVTYGRPDRYGMIDSLFGHIGRTCEGGFTDDVTSLLVEAV